MSVVIPCSFSVDCSSSSPHIPSSLYPIGMIWQQWSKPPGWGEEAAQPTAATVTPDSPNRSSMSANDQKTGVPKRPASRGTSVDNGQATASRGSQLLNQEKPQSEWREVKDAASGRFYYYNAITKETSWTKPAELIALNTETNPVRVLPLSFLSIVFFVLFSLPCLCSMIQRIDSCALFLYVGLYPARTMTGKK